MELADGYKLTDIGVIPDDWDTKSYGALFDFLRTATFSRSDLTRSDDVSYVHYGDIHTKINDYLDLNKVELPTVSSEMAKRYTLLAEGDLIIVDASEDYEGVGKSAEVRNVGTKKAISGLHTFLLRGKTEELSNGFKAYLHSNPLIKSQFKKLATGMKVFGVNKSNLKTVEIPLPPVPEQEVIAEVLSDVDALILALDDLIEKKRNIKQGAMQQLLTGKKRVAASAAEWQPVTLEQLCVPGGLVRGPFGGMLKKEFFVRDGIKVYEQRNAIYRNCEVGTYFISPEKFAELKRFEVTEGDFIVSCSGTIGRIYQIPNGARQGIINQALLKIRTDSTKIHDGFFYYLFDWDKFQDQIIDNTQGGAMKNLVGMDVFRVAEMTVPPSIDEQKTIWKILRGIDDELDSLLVLRTKHSLLKEAMIQQLLTGKTRLI